MNSTHPYTDHDFIKSKNFPQKYKKANASLNLEEVIPVKKVVAVGTKRSNSFKGTQLSLVSKYYKKIKYVDIASYYCPSKLPVTAKCEDVDYAFRKGFCLSMVHTGVNKNLSNNAIIENYRTAINEITEYHKFLSEVNLGIPAGYIFFCLSSFLLLIVGQDDKIQISKL